jgi:hypothetical protein
MKSLFSTIPHHVHLRMPPVAPRGRLEAPESADVRLQLSAWYSLSRFAAGSLPTPPGFQAAALRFNNTKSFYTTNEIHCTIVNPSTPDEARQSCQHELHAKPQPPRCTVVQTPIPRLCTTSCRLVLPLTITTLNLFEHSTSTCRYLWSCALKLKLSNIFVFASDSTPSLLRHFEHSLL